MLSFGGVETYEKEVVEIVEPPTVEEMIAEYDWNVEHALIIASCESGMRVDVVNDDPSTRDYSVGLFQVNLYGNLKDHRPSEEWLKIPENNIEYAYKLWSQTKSFNRHWVNCSKRL